MTEKEALNNFADYSIVCQLKDHKEKVFSDTLSSLKLNDFLKCAEEEFKKGTAVKNTTKAFVEQLKNGAKDKEGLLKTLDNIKLFYDNGVVQGTYFKATINDKEYLFNLNPKTCTSTKASSSEKNHAKNTETKNSDLVKAYIKVIAAMFLMSFYYNGLVGNGEDVSPLAGFSMFYQLMYLLYVPAAISFGLALNFIKNKKTFVSGRSKENIVSNSLSVISVSLSGVIIDTIAKYSGHQITGIGYEFMIFYFLPYMLLSSVISFQIEKKEGK